jgi:hypothetical protein
MGVPEALGIGEATVGNVAVPCLGPQFVLVVPNIGTSLIQNDLNVKVCSI